MGRDGDDEDYNGRKQIRTEPRPVFNGSFSPIVHADVGFSPGKTGVRSCRGGWSSPRLSAGKPQSGIPSTRMHRPTVLRTPTRQDPERHSIHNDKRKMKDLRCFFGPYLKTAFPWRTVQRSFPLPTRFSKLSCANYSMSAQHLSAVPPSRSLRGKVAIVTGAGCVGDGVGNGRAISILLANDGCDVICLDMNQSWAEKTAEIVNQEEGRGGAIAAQGDVTSDQDCKAAVDLALERFGRLDILVNNVGVAGAPGTAVEVDMDNWAKSLDINVSSMVRMVKHAVPAMERNEGEIKGAIINMGSVAGLRGGTPHLLYPTSKGAVVNMTRAMAAHHARSGIRVNCVCPGVSWRIILIYYPIRPY